MRTRIRAVVLLLAGLLVGAGGLVAQTGTITGTVTNRESGAALADANVSVLPTAGGAAVARTQSGANGSYRLEVAPGSYTVLVAAIGFQAARVQVTVTAGGTVRADAALAPSSQLLDPVVVSASRVQEKAIEAPASIHVVPAVDITERPVLSVTDHLKALPGVDISQGGMVQSNVVGRGFNNIFSGAMLMIVDNRFAAVPSLRVNVPAFFPNSNNDIEQIEFVLGPGAALYGPNTANGVLSLTTKSPIASPGTQISLESGYRADSRQADGTELDRGHGVLRLGLRHAEKLSDRWGFKLSADYLKAEEWRARDAAEPATLPGRRCDSGFGCRNFDINKWTMDGRLDWRPTTGAEVVAAAGRNTAVNLIEYTGIGAAQARDWSYTYYQLRARYNRLYAQVFRNQSNSGNDSPRDNTGSFLLRDGQPVVDRSNVTAAQFQHGFLLGDRLDLIYGVDFAKTLAVTDSTINGRNEEDDDITEVGGYVHAKLAIGDKIDLVGALRGDYHSRIEETVLSPRLALVYMPTENHNLRVTYNRAFSTPSNNNLFLDIVAARAGPFRVRALGVPETGFSFRGYCGAGGIDNLCMRGGPFPGVPAQTLPAQAATLWGVAAAAVAPALGQLAPLLLGVPAPSATAVGTQLRRLNPTQGKFFDIAPDQVADISAIKPTITSSYELGYKGIINNQFRVSVDGWFQQKKDFVGPLIVESPNVFLNLQQTAAHLTTYLYPALLQFMPAAQAQATIQQVAVGMAGLSGGSGATTGVPLGTVVPNSPLTQSSDIFLTYRNFGEVELWGLDFAMDYFFGDYWSISGTASFVNDDYFAAADINGPTDLALNASKAKGSATVRYRHDRSGWAGEVRGRYVKGFPVNSGVYVSTEPINNYGLLDGQVTWRPRFNEHLTFTVLVENALNKNYSTFVGIPQLGRLVMTKMQFAF